MAAAEKVLIVGGGIGGMVLAHGLARKGLQVRVIERKKKGDQLGTGICLLSNTIRALDQFDLADKCIKKGFGYDTITNYTSAGHFLNEVSVPRTYRDDIPSTVGIMRTILAQLLESEAEASGAHISYETTFEDISQDSDQVIARFSTGEVDQFDLLVAADGAYSDLRRKFFGNVFETKFCGQSVWRYTIPRPKELNGMVFYRHGDGRLVGGIPLSNELYYIFLLETSSEPIKMQKEKLGELLRERLTEFTAPMIREAVDLIDGPKNISFRPFDILFMPSPWHKGRVVLLGDAAHSFSPQLTSGGGMAVEDALVLTEELFGEGSLDQALTRYAERRALRAKTVYDNSLQICLWEQHPEGGDTARAMQLMVESYRFMAQPC